jgi:hypothetical protein
MGALKAKRTSAEPVFECQRCGLVIDRDANAASNLVQLAASGTLESINACGVEVRGPDEAASWGARYDPATLGTLAHQDEAGIRHRVSGQDRPGGQLVAMGQSALVLTHNGSRRAT